MPLDRNFTVTPENPTPPTNIPCYGATPPTPPELEPQDDGDPLEPTLFAAPTGGEPHENAGTEEVVIAGEQTPKAEGDPEPEETDAETVFTPDTVSVSTNGDYTATPNASHPSYVNDQVPEDELLMPRVNEDGVQRLIIEQEGDDDDQEHQ